MTIVRFEIVTREKSVAFFPLVNSVSLIELVTGYERNRNWQPAGGYSGLIPNCYNSGPIDSYLLGKRQATGLSDSGKIALLGCECGEVGCWPLLARVKTDDRLIIWTDFEQPHRPERDYSSFGPFDFDREQYEKVLEDLQTKLHEASSRQLPSD